MCRRRATFEDDGMDDEDDMSGGRSNCRLVRARRNRCRRRLAWPAATLRRRGRRGPRGPTTVCVTNDRVACAVRARSHTRTLCEYFCLVAPATGRASVRSAAINVNDRFIRNCRVRRIRAVAETSSAQRSHEWSSEPLVERRETCSASGDADMCRRQIFLLFVVLSARQ